MSGPVSLCAPAKINLALHVTGRRDDGFHLLHTMVVFAEPGDRISAQPAAEDRFAISGPFAAGLPAGDDNLVIRARQALRRTISGELPPVSITLEKNLPPASGIGGGSSDAAATLRALSTIWGLGLEDETLCEIGSGLGADVPMCVLARPLIATGTGERLETIAPCPALAMVLANPGVAVSTPDVFGRLEQRASEDLPPFSGLRDQSDLRQRIANTRNDLQEPALQVAPIISDVLAELDSCGAVLSRMSGSGATCFGLYGDMADAKAAAKTLSGRHPDWYVRATETRAA